MCRLGRITAYFRESAIQQSTAVCTTGGRAEKAGHIVVMLLPADKSTRWYQVIQENASEVIDIIGGRINFINPLTDEEVKATAKARWWRCSIRLWRE